MMARIKPTEQSGACPANVKKSRWGRRKPYLIVGAVLGAFMLNALWWASPNWSSTAILIYLGVLGTLFYICYGLYTMAWTAVGYELTMRASLGELGKPRTLRIFLGLPSPSAASLTFIGNERNASQGTKLRGPLGKLGSQRVDTPFTQDRFEQKRGEVFGLCEGDIQSLKIISRHANDGQAADGNPGTRAKLVHTLKLEVLESLMGQKRGAMGCPLFG